MTSIVAYKVTNDGNWDSTAFKKDYLNPKEVFILVNEEKKELWIWVGQKSEVRTRFISSTVAQEIRRLYGLTLRVKAADQGNEPIEFWECIDSIPKDGLDIIKNKKELITSTYLNKVDLHLESMVNKKSFNKIEKKSEIQKSDLSTKKDSTRSSQNIRKKVSDITKTLENCFKTNPSLFTTPPCPRCKDGHLLPYSQIVKITARKKEVLPIYKWICSNCDYSPYNNESE